MYAPRASSLCRSIALAEQDMHMHSLTIHAKHNQTGSWKRAAAQIHISLFLGLHTPHILDAARMTGGSP
jgi:hypothetical protein